jgi:hypothetical protein
MISCFDIGENDLFNFKIQNIEQFIIKVSCSKLGIMYLFYNPHRIMTLIHKKKFFAKKKSNDDHQILFIDFKVSNFLIIKIKKSIK